MKLIKGQKIFWRWKDSRTTYSEQVFIEQNGEMIALADSECSGFTSWFKWSVIDVVIKDMSKESK